MSLHEFAHQGWQFEVTDGGDPAGTAVVLLHGFPADRHCWEGVAGTLADGGYRTLAPDQRGYSPGARPRGRRAYRIGSLVGDVLALADAAGVARFDVVGHDWGAVVAWHLAARHGDRVRSVAALSVPHPGAFAQALRHTDQLRHSWYMAAFQVPVLPERVLALGHGSRLRAGLEATGLDPVSAAHYAERAAQRAMSGPLGWYRAMPLDAYHRVPPVTIPALFVWGDGDRYVTARAAGLAAAWMRGPARCETLRGVGHWIPEMAAPSAAELILEHLGAVEV